MTFAALDRAIARTEGPVVLAAHAYAGAVISATKSDRVKALAYIAALPPDEGETVADVFYREAPHRMHHNSRPMPRDYGMPGHLFKSTFAQHAATERLALLAPRKGRSMSPAFRNARQDLRGDRRPPCTWSRRKIT